MKKDSKIAVFISGCMILSGILMFLYILPFLYIWASFCETETQDKLDSMKKSVNTSIFEFQKVYTMNSALASLVLTKDYYTVIAYYKDLEKLGAVDEGNTYLAVYSYIQTGEYNNALKYAQMFGNKGQLAQIYIKIKDFKKAKILVNEMLNQKPVKTRVYRYKAEIEMGENNWKEAYNSINKALKFAPNSVEALQDKVRISKHLGYKNEYKKSLNKLKLIELKRGNI